MIHFLGNGNPQIIADGYPDLRIDCILTCFIERLDVPVLIDPFKKAFHLPALPVKFCNIQVGISKIICQEPINIESSIIFIHNYKESFGILFRYFQTWQSDNRITDSSNTFVNRSLLYHLIFHVVFSPRYKEGILTMEMTEQLPKISVIFIHKVAIAMLYSNMAHRLGVVNGSYCQIDKRWYVTIQIKQCVYLHIVFAMMHMSP